MFRGMITGTLAAGALTLASAASAQPVDPDLRCFALSNAFASLEKDPLKKQLAVASTFFFLGRIDGKLSPAQIIAQLSSPAASLKQAEAGPLMNACAKRVQEAQRALMTTGRAVPAPQPKK